MNSYFQIKQGETAEVVIEGIGKMNVSVLPNGTVLIWHDFNEVMLRHVSEATK